VVPATEGRADSGMVVDFGVIKQVLMERIHDRFDHRLILWGGDPLLANRALEEVLAAVGLADGIRVVPVIPTSEGLAQYWAGLIAPDLNCSYFRLSALDVWETPNSVATYVPPTFGPSSRVCDE
jgi:6-pyruvoyl-tetrahydropterin synthase